MPNRIIKETITTSCEIDQLSADEERFFYRLIVACDDYGRMDARPAVLRAKCFPLKVDAITNNDIERWLKKLIKIGLITLYDAEGKPFLFMIKWEKHQQRRAKHSKYPAPDSDMISNDINGYQTQEDVPEESRNRGIEESIFEESRSKNIIPYSEIISHLNDKAGKNYKATTRVTKDAIKARWNEGHRLTDFKAVIDKKCAQWASDEKMEQYLRPQTLFGTKFEAYLNEKGGRAIEQGPGKYEHLYN